MPDAYNKKERIKLKVIGVGPGDPGCLTVKVINEIENTPLLFVPKSAVKSHSLALQIAGPHINKNHSIHELVYPMTKDKTELKEAWLLAAKRVSTLLNKYKNAVFLTLGDPSVYSTWTYLRTALLHEGHTDDDWEIIPGISSFSYGAARIKKELAIGDESFCILSMPHTYDKLKSCVSLFKTIVIMKIGTKWPLLREWLEALHLEKSTDIVSRAGLKNQYIAPFAKGVPEKAEYLSIAIINQKE